MENASAIAAETKTSSLIRLTKSWQNIEITTIWKILTHNPDFWSISKKVRYRIYYIFDNEAENKI